MADHRPYELVHSTLQECLNGNNDPAMIRASLDLVEAMREPHLLAKEHGGTWGEFPMHWVSDWQYQVEECETRLGYWEWVANQLDASAEDDPDEHTPNTSP